MADDTTGSEGSPSNARGVLSGPAVVTSGKLDPYLDAANRLERNLDEQIATLREINGQAEHVTRLLALLLGVLTSGISIGVRWFDGAKAPTPSGSVQLVFVLGVGALILSMSLAIVTYLRSRYKIGLNATVGQLLENPNYEADMDRHIRRVLGTYAYNIEHNTTIIEVNSRRFRWSLLLLLVGVLCIVAAAAMFAIEPDGSLERLLAIGVVVCAGGISWYVLSDKYLT